MPTGDQPLVNECLPAMSSDDGLGGILFLLFAMEPQLKDQKNVMVELNVLPACDANWRSTTPVSCL